MKTVHRTAFAALIVSIPFLLAACNFPTRSPITPSQPPTERTPDQTGRPDQAGLPSSTPEAYTPDKQIPSTGVLDSCLVGTWRLEDSQSILTALIPPEIIQERVIRFQESRGNILYTFRRDGTALAEARDFQAAAVMDAGAIEIDLVVSLNGQGSAQYQEDTGAETLRFFNPDAEQFDLSVRLGGVSVFQDISLPDLVWFHAMDAESQPLPYTCQDNSLSIRLPIEREGQDAVRIPFARH